MKETVCRYEFTFGERRLVMDGRPYVMGIVNVTPDSFSDGGCYDDVDKAVRHGLELLAEGADFLDIGGESTRPGHAPVTVEEELRRVVPVISELRRQSDVPISVDTMKCAVAEAAIAAGADILNDVTGLDLEREAKCRLLARTGAGCIVMHWQDDKERVDADAMSYVDWVTSRLCGICQAATADFGIDPSRFMLDPGVGFGKTDWQNLALVDGLAEMRAAGYPVLLGISRKSLIGRILSQDVPKQRLLGTAALTAAAAYQDVDVHRVHDVAAMREVLAVVRAVRTHEVGGR